MYSSTDRIVEKRLFVSKIGVIKNWNTAAHSTHQALKHSVPQHGKVVR